MMPAADATIILYGLGLTVALALFAVAMSFVQARRLDRQAERLLGVETALKHLPSRDDLHRIELQLRDAAAANEIGRERQAVMGQQLSRIEDYLMRDRSNANI